MFRNIKILLLGIVLPLMVIFATFLCHLPEVVSGVIRTGAFIVFINCFLFIIFKGQNKQERYIRGRNLFQWMDKLDDYDQDIMYSLKRASLVYQTVNNLNSIKEVLLQVTKGDKKRLKMYREFYKQQLQQTGEELYLKTILLSLIPVGLFIIKEFGTKIGQLESYIYVYITIISLIAFISMMLKDNKKRIGFIISMIDLCIEDIEEEERKELEKKIEN